LFGVQQKFWQAPQIKFWQIDKILTSIVCKQTKKIYNKARKITKTLNRIL